MPFEIPKGASKDAKEDPNTDDDDDEENDDHDGSESDEDEPPPLADSGSPTSKKFTFFYST